MSRPSETPSSVFLETTSHVRVERASRPPSPEEFVGSEAFVPAALNALVKGVRRAVAEDRAKGAAEPE